MLSHPAPSCWRCESSLYPSVCTLYVLAAHQSSPGGCLGYYICVLMALMAKEPLFYGAAAPKCKRSDGGISNMPKKTLKVLL